MCLIHSSSVPIASLHYIISQIGTYSCCHDLLENLIWYIGSMLHSFVLSFSSWTLNTLWIVIKLCNNVYLNKFHFICMNMNWSGIFFLLCNLKGSHLRVASCLLLPAIQLVVGISHPSWVSLPFFIGSCAGVVDWSLTSNFLGLFRLLLFDSLYVSNHLYFSFPLSMISPWSLVGLHFCIWFLRWWRLLQLYACFNIILLYVYQLPVNFSSMFQWMADFVGLFKVSSNSEWPEICSSFSLILFYIMVCTVHVDNYSKKKKW